MKDRTANLIIDQLTIGRPDVKITQVTQELSDDIFAQQKDKHLLHGEQGGVIGIILTPEDKIVLAHRSKFNSGWSLPGGTVEKGETFEDTFKREIQEEVGVETYSSCLVLVEKKLFISPSQEVLPFVLATYVARIVETTLPEPTPDSLREGLKIDLFDLDDLPNDMIFGDKNKIEVYARKTKSFAF